MKERDQMLKLYFLCMHRKRRRMTRGTWHITRTRPPLFKFGFIHPPLFATQAVFLSPSFPPPSLFYLTGVVATALIGEAGETNVSSSAAITVGEAGAALEVGESMVAFLLLGDERKPMFG